MCTRPSTLFLTVTLFAFLITPLSVPANQSESPLPYIYYYADTLESLVVEHVDGSDSRVLAEVPPGNSLFWSVDWSPSGAWVAFLNGRATEGGNNILTLGVVSSDGRKRSRQLDGLHDVTYIRWSPVDDVLYVVDRLDFSSIRLLLVDVPADKILAQFTYHSVGVADFAEYPPGGSWSFDGQHTYTEIFTDEKQTLITLSRNETVEVRVFDGTREHALEDSAQGRALYITGRWQDEYAPRLIMQDVTSGRQVVILADDPEVKADANWNDDLTYALVELRWLNDHYDVIRAEYHLLDWVAGTVTPLTASLPEQMSKSRLRLVGKQLWSSDGRLAVLHDDQGNLAVLHARTGYIETINVSNVLKWDWATDDLGLWIQVVQEEPIRSKIYRYDLESQQLKPFPVLEGGSEYSRFQFSPDETIGARLPSLLGPLVDLEIGKTIPLIHHSLAQSGMQTVGVVWHESSDWYMTGEHISYAGGGGGPEAITLYSRDGTLRRELGECDYYDTCAGFVPERAVPYLGSGQAQSVVAEPILTLKHDQRVEAVAWSPNENLLAAYGLSFPPSGDEGTLTIWRVADNEAHEVETYAVDIVCWQYPGSCLMTWRDDNTIVFDDEYGAAWVLDLTTHEAQPIAYSAHNTSPDGLYRVELYDSKLTIVNIERDEIVLEIERDEDVNSGFLMSHWLSEGHTLLIQRYDGRILRWDGEDLQPIGSGAVMYGYAYHEQAGLLATGSLYYRISIIDIEAGEHLSDINWAGSALAFNADGSLLAAGGTQLVSIWDMTRYRR